MSKKLWVGLPAFLLFVCPIRAQLSLEVSVLRVELVGGIPLEQQLDEEIVMRVKEGIVLPSQFHVRIFRGSLNYQTGRMKDFADTQGCITYPSRVLYGTLDSRLHFQALSNFGWLETSRDGHYKTQDLVLVFEAGEPPSTDSIRLHKTQVATYFQYAVPMHLNPSNDAKAASAQIVEETRRALEQRSTQFSQLPRGPCYSVTRLAPHAGGSSSGEGISEAATVRESSCGNSHYGEGENTSGGGLLRRSIWRPVASLWRRGSKGTGSTGLLALKQ